MEVFVSIFMFVVFVLALQSFLKSGKSPKTKQSDQRRSRNGSNNVDWQKRTQSVAKQAAMRKAMESGADTMQSVRHVARDPNDKNRHRRDDWGERAGPGLLSMRNTIILLSIAIVAYVIMYQLPSNVLR